MQFSFLSQYSSEFILESRKELAHHSFYIIICQSLIKILKYEAKCILLLSFRNLITSVHIEKSYLLEELLTHTEGALAKISISYRLIKKKSKVTSYLREFRKL